MQDNRHENNSQYPASPGTQLCKKISRFSLIVKYYGNEEYDHSINSDQQLLAVSPLNAFILFVFFI